MAIATSTGGAGGAPFAKFNNAGDTLVGAFASDPTACKRQARNFEMMRIKYSPRNPKVPQGISMNAYRACETARVHIRAARDGVITDHYGQFSESDVDELAAHFKKHGPMVAACAWVEACEARHTNHDANIVAQAAEKAWADDYTTYHKFTSAAVCAHGILTQRNNPGPNAAIEAAKAMQWAISPPKPPVSENQVDPDNTGKPRPKNSPKQPSHEEVAESAAQGGRYRDDVDARIDKRVAWILDEEHRKNPKANSWDRFDRTEAGWCDVTFHDDIPMPHRLTGRMKAPGLVPRDTGSVFRYHQNYCTNQAVFAGKIVKEGGASVLIDTSGSMRLSIEDIAEIVQTLPGAIIATYCGDFATGDLRVVARNGMWVDDHNLSASMGGNAIDGPALIWLSKQKGPRFWVSDGQVFGKRGADTIDLHAEVRGICLKHRILRLNDINACKEYVRRTGIKTR
jgi:hypothetical protein